MAYLYQDLKHTVFTEDGQLRFLRIRDKANALAKQAGCFTMGKAIAGETGVNWEMMACVDRLVEIGEFKEISQGYCASQNRIFVKVGE